MALSEMTVRNVVTGETTVIRASEEDGTFGLFGFVGYEPNSALFEGKVDMKDGYIVTDEDMHTSVPGVFAAGDLRVKSLRQVITAAADGAIAAVQCEKYLSH
jgi:thioredoxin reductase (NADPH)